FSRKPNSASCALEKRASRCIASASTGSHTRSGVSRSSIRSATQRGCYSPDLNPIEQVFAKLKHLLRKAAARTVEAIGQAIGQLLGTFTPEECANYFRNSGYALT